MKGVANNTPVKTTRYQGFFFSFFENQAHHVIGRIPTHSQHIINLHLLSSKGGHVDALTLK